MFNGLLKKQEAEPSGNEAQENSIHAASNNQLDTSPPHKPKQHQ